MYPIHLKFAVYGSSGSGKSTLIETVQKVAPNITVHRKDTTRQPRETESLDGTLDLRFLDRTEFDKNTEKGEYDVVLVGADSVKDLKRAYPNYFLDTKEFLIYLNKILNNQCR